MLFYFINVIVTLSVLCFSYYFNYCDIFLGFGIVWPDELMGPLSLFNKKFPFPENIGVMETNQALSHSR